ncbi:hypothetical protein EVAR_75823_1 [Eumeta japonica]|uniref:Uncharacterized protein n=1 Tax=Eumeta variegata TaxID=151549 RepID=A0A4C1TE35_EUMVA|nr:hypothetical protein EVAR_75823_1 [Eumeta japonica]
MRWNGTIYFRAAVPDGGDAAGGAAAWARRTRAVRSGGKKLSQRRLAQLAVPGPATSRPLRRVTRLNAP